ncbi:MAG TPA: PfkB family carbohydrate kinase [Spirochaetota bacterium]|nr:PfkB family carbohydrate kinase [Spirochaetota bacterium]HQO03361.1 PfkB family carbohydrate kinase [Spirochaetota bacterium]HQP47989.1 PfkB family carbohydrate kinase [Spirochaetota bacterium]
MMILAVGEILIDKFPAYRRIGGAPFNFAYHIRGLGFDVQFASRIGADESGKEVISFLRERGFGTELIQVDPSRPTGEVNISLDSSGAAEYNIPPDAAYDYLKADDTLVHALKESSLVYFGTLVQRGPGFEELHHLLSLKEREAITIYDVNLRRDCYSEEIIRASLDKSDIVKLNDDELKVLRDVFHFRGNEKEFAEFIMERYSVSMISVTKGERGSALYTPDTYAEAGPVKIADLVDTVGAGDGYTAVIAAGYLKGMDTQNIVNMASEFAGQICGIKGALPGGEAFYDMFRRRLHGGAK